MKTIEQKRQQIEKEKRAKMGKSAGSFVAETPSLPKEDESRGTGKNRKSSFAMKVSF